MVFVTSIPQDGEVINMRRPLIAVGLAALFALTWPATGFAAGGPLPNIGTAGNYAVLAAATVTNTGPSWITGQSFAIDGGHELRRNPDMTDLMTQMYGQKAMDAVYKGQAPE